MLILKSFKMEDEKGMNELLATTRIAAGASVFVSNGEIIIPIEDGLPLNKAQQIIKVKEDRNLKELTLGPLEHTQNVLDIVIAELHKQIDNYTNTLEVSNGAKGKVDYNDKARIEFKLKNLKAVLSNKEREYEDNKAEIDEVKVHLKVYDDKLSDLNDFAD